MSARIDRLVTERKLIRSRVTREMILKEIDGAESDLKVAENSLAGEQYKWATIQGYYSVFHSARALLYSRGLREKSHYALLQAMQELFNGELENSLIKGFDEAMNLRQEADYGLTFSEDGAKDTVQTARSFLARAKTILKIES